MVESLMLRHQSKWLRFVQRMVQNRADAEDVLQDAVVKMLLRDRRFCSPEQARMYLGRIICNTAIEHYHRRMRKRRQHRPLNEQLLAATDMGEQPPSLEEGEDLGADVRMLTLLNEGLAHLPVKQYEALRLTVLDSRIASIRDAGAVHDIPYSTLRHRKVQGLRRLKRFFDRALRAASLKSLVA